MSEHIGNPDRFAPGERRLHDDEIAKKFEDGGRKPIPENEITADMVAFQVATINKILPREMVSAFGNHYLLYKDMHRDEWAKPLAVLSRCADEIGESLRYYFRGRHQAHDLPQGNHSGPCIIIGSGCSLNDALPHLRKWGGGLICSSSHASTLQKYGAPPKHILNFDPFSAVEEFDAKPYDYAKTVMITHTGINPALHDWWKGTKYLYRVYDPAVYFYAYALSTGYNWIETQMQPFSHSIPMQMAAANFMGYSPLILMGCDQCYHETVRFDAWHYQKPTGEKRKRWVLSPGEPTQNAQNTNHIRITTAGGRLTDYVMTHYRTTTVAMSWVDNMHVVDASDGLLDGLYPKADIREVIETQGAKIRPQARSTRERLEPWLAVKQHYFVPMLEGHKLVVAQNMVHLEGMVRMLHDTYDPTIDVAAIMMRFRNVLEEGETKCADGTYGRAGLTQ